jgi:hypothetical protein
LPQWFAEHSDVCDCQFILQAACVADASAAAAVPDGPTKTFFAGPRAVAYDAVSAYCEANHGTVATVQSADEDAAAVAACRDATNGASGCWIGLEHVDNGWHWVDGTEANYTNWDASQGEAISGEANVFYKPFAGSQMWHDIARTAAGIYPLCQKSGGGCRQIMYRNDGCCYVNRGTCQVVVEKQSNCGAKLCTSTYTLANVVAEPSGAVVKGAAAVAAATADLMRDLVLDLNPAAQDVSAIETSDSSPSRMRFNVLPVQIFESEIKAWDLDVAHFSLTPASPRPTIGQDYTQLVWVDWLVSNFSLLTTFGDVDCGTIAIRPDSAMLGLYNKADAPPFESVAGAGYAVITSSKPGFAFVAVVGRGDSVTASTGTSTYFVGTVAAVPNRIGTVGRVCSGHTYAQIGHHSQGPGKVARAMAWNRALTETEITQLYHRTHPILPAVTMVSSPSTRSATATFTTTATASINNAAAGSTAIAAATTTTTTTTTITTTTATATSSAATQPTTTSLVASSRSETNETAGIIVGGVIGVLLLLIAVFGLLLYLKLEREKQSGGGDVLVNNGADIFGMTVNPLGVAHGAAIADPPYANIAASTNASLYANSSTNHANSSSVSPTPEYAEVADPPARLNTRVSRDIYGYQIPADSTRDRGLSGCMVGTASEGGGGKSTAAAVVYQNQNHSSSSGSADGADGTKSHTHEVGANGGAPSAWDGAADKVVYQNGDEAMHLINTSPITNTNNDESMYQNDKFIETALSATPPARSPAGAGAGTVGYINVDSGDGGGSGISDADLTSGSGSSQMVVYAVADSGLVGAPT